MPCLPQLQAVQHAAGTAPKWQPHQQPQAQSEEEAVVVLQPVLSMVPPTAGVALLEQSPFAQQPQPKPVTPLPAFKPRPAPRVSGLTTPVGQQAAVFATSQSLPPPAPLVLAAPILQRVASLPAPQALWVRTLGPEHLRAAAHSQQLAQQPTAAPRLVAARPQLQPQQLTPAAQIQQQQQCSPTLRQPAPASPPQLQRSPKLTQQHPSPTLQPCGSSEELPLRAPSDSSSGSVQEAMNAVLAPALRPLQAAAAAAPAAQPQVS